MTNIEIATLSLFLRATDDDVRRHLDDGDAPTTWEEVDDGVTSMRGAVDLGGAMMTVSTMPRQKGGRFAMTVLGAHTRAIAQDDAHGTGVAPQVIGAQTVVGVILEPPVTDPHDRRLALLRSLIGHAGGVVFDGQRFSVDVVGDGPTWPDAMIDDNPHVLARDRSTEI